MRRMPCRAYVGYPRVSTVGGAALANCLLDLLSTGLLTFMPQPCARAGGGQPAPDWCPGRAAARRPERRCTSASSHWVSRARRRRRCARTIPKQADASARRRRRRPAWRPARTSRCSRAAEARARGAESFGLIPKRSGQWRAGAPRDVRIRGADGRSHAAATVEHSVEFEPTLVPPPNETNPRMEPGKRVATSRGE